LHPYSNLTCISSWYICIPNIIWIHQTITEKMNGNCHYHECDGWTDRHHHTIIRPVFNGRIKINFYLVFYMFYLFCSCITLINVHCCKSHDTKFCFRLFKINSMFNVTRARRFCWNCCLEKNKQIRI
jgi:hypothetical protein